MKFIITFIFSAFFLPSFAQKSFNDYAQVYPIGDDPTMRYMTSYLKQETILFEANPVLRLSFYNNFLKGLANNLRHTQAWYIAFRPQLRMYTENSLPVKTPSYRIFIATQHLYRLRAPSDSAQHFIGFSIESGHYSNGQAGGAFTQQFEDGTPQSDSVYTTINSSTNLSQLLNRRSGNFSTNLTELILNYRWYRLDDEYLPKTMHSVNAGYTLYHDRFWGVMDFGGFSDNDIAIYGRHRFMLAYEYMRVLKKCKEKIISLRQNFEYIYKPHHFVNRLRSESVITFYPFQNSEKHKYNPKAFGFFISYIYGHDNYNFRFVDSGSQLTAGITFTQFPPVQLKKLE